MTSRDDQLRLIDREIISLNGWFIGANSEEEKRRCLAELSLWQSIRAIVEKQGGEK